MTLIEICITVYLILGGLATVLIWAALMASKPHGRKASHFKYNQLEYNPLRERDTRPSRFLT